jgi:hypothetical protein
MTFETDSPPLMRRVGDVIQAIAVLAIVGLAVAVIDLRVTLVQNQSKINSQKDMYAQQLLSLRENLELQMKVLESIVQRVTAGGFDASRGRILEQSVTALGKRVDAHDITITKLHQTMFKYFANDGENTIFKK